ncbi:MaoC/PaaZ C-terminal domain-containing protein [Massilibacterium senegalense]|uniref:MaoC/PaaZ C-terminal domain-containing protein n=1 Tax=Massilibacterium senegalense TaxID=1632858 RepID=UPI000781B8F6|nr:MaoC/PaaZ C-terminal domain-containing protein [Massilibacterium senegalense]
MLQPITKGPITHTQLVRYAGASGDFNPIHTVVPAAKLAGLDDTIAHGMLLMGFAATALTTWFPYEQLKKWEVTFKKMTFPGECLTITGHIVGEKQDGFTQYGELVIQNEKKEIKLVGVFDVMKEDKDEHIG